MSYSHSTSGRGIASGESTLLAIVFTRLTNLYYSLAYAEMRLILARVIFNFDIEIAEDSKGWMERQKIFLFWKKGPLNVHLTPVQHR